MYEILILHQLIASTTHIIAKDLTGSLPPEMILFVRAGIACLAFAVWMFFRRKKTVRFEKKDIFIWLLLGFLNIPGNQFIFFKAIQLVPAPNVALAYALSPAFVLVIAILFLKESASALKLGGVALAVAGTVVVLLERGLVLTGDYFLGNLLALAASFSWALYTVLGKKFSLKYGAIFATALAMFSGFIEFIPIYFISGFGLDFSRIAPTQWAELLYLGFGTSVLGYVLWFYALKKIEASKASVFTNLQPVFTTIMAFIFFGQSVSATFLVGGVIIIIGVVAAQRG